MTAYAFVSFGLFGAVADPPGGERLLVERLKAIGVDTRDSPYSWSDVGRTASEIESLPADALVIAGGDSLGANEAPQIAELVARKIDLLFGFQPSDYGEHLVNSKGEPYIIVPGNVIHAICIWDSRFWETLGLGNCPWAKERSNRTTTLESHDIHAAHPDDFGPAQDIVFEAIKRLVGK